MADNEKIFDDILRKNLKKHYELISDNFAEQLLVRIERAEQQKTLKKVCLQEKISLAAFILLPLIMITIMIAFPSKVAGTGQMITGLVPLIFHVIAAMIKQWQMIVYYSIGFLACLYALYQMLGAEN
ncbi:MAG: hypothetical protein A2Y10_14120 [Planctomycetes bacterium GWF2_41_51]|nr:MAG: hypothetical protein A2Y10_14120 [Planctomycetes bacterium GWF2_41_51]